MSAKKWSDEQVNWVQENRINFDSINEITDAFNERYGLQVGRNTIVGLLRKNGQKASLGKNHKFTEEEDQWLREHYPSTELIADELVKEFNAKFKAHLSGWSLKARCQRLDIKKADLLNFIGKNTHRAQRVELLSEYKATNGYIMIKVNDIHTKGNRNFRKNWKLKQVYVWEQAFGKVPEGYSVFFLDGNKENFDLNNLALATTKEILHLKTLRWFGKGEATKAGLEAIRAEQTLVDMGCIKRRKSDLSRLKEWSKNKKNTE